MKIVQTLFVKADPFKNSFGWRSVKDHLMGWALSTLQINKLYGGSEIYCNSDAAFLFEKLQLPLKELFLTHDCMNKYPLTLWALPKVYTYSLQKQAFLHVDGDVFIFQPFNKDLIEAGLIAQNMEVATSYYASTQKQISENFDFIPDLVRKDFESEKFICAVNAGILGGSDIPFIQGYTETAFQYVQRNLECLSQVNADRFNVFFEQHLFYVMSKAQNKEVALLFQEVTGDTQYQNLGDFHEVPCSRSYIHLLGQYKRDSFTCLQMQNKLKELYPHYYYRIAKLCYDKGIDSTASSYMHYLNDINYSKIHNIARAKFLGGKASSEKFTLPRNFHCLEILQNAIDCFFLDNAEGADQSFVRHDFLHFSQALLEGLSDLPFDNDYLYGRDLESPKWYCYLFCQESQGIENTIIERSKENFVLSSRYNWSGLLNKQLRVGVDYYSSVQIEEGEFYHMVIPEVSEQMVSLIDLDETQNLILSLLAKPCTVADLMKRLEAYIDEEVIQFHFEEFRNLFFVYLKELVINRAIFPHY